MSSQKKRKKGKKKEEKKILAHTKEPIIHAWSLGKEKDKNIFSGMPRSQTSTLG